MTTNNISERVAELSATLAPINQALTFVQYAEVMGIADESISYNSPYYCNGLQRVDYEDNVISCVFDKAGEYQVLRYFATHVYNDGEGMYQYYANELAHQDEDDYMDDGEYDDNLEVKASVEYKQIWIDRKGHTETIILNDMMQFKEREIFCHVLSKQNWLENNPQVALYLLSSIDEYDDYCHTYPEDEDIVLKGIRQSFIQFARRFNPEFVDEIVDHGYTDKFIQFYRTFKVLAKHHIDLPKGYENIRIYFNCLENLERNNVCLTEPRYINPTQLIADYREEQDRLAKEREEKAKQKAIENEERFNREHSWLFGIEFEDDHFHYRSLDSVEAYRVEGDIMHHCIFNCEFYNNHDMLAMHITDLEGNRVATCTINVKTGEIDQIQPMCNDKGYYDMTGVKWQTTNDYKWIWNTLMARMHTFPKKPQKPVIQVTIKVA